MGRIRLLLIILAIAAALGALAWFGGFSAQAPQVADAASDPAASVEPLRIGLIPERDIFEQHRRYQALADHLSARLHRPVKLLTVRSYRDILQEFRDHRVDAAFLGSLVTVLSIEQVSARVLVRPEQPDGFSTYRGVIFVPADSPIRQVEDLAGRSIAMVPTTTGASLFPVAEFVRRGMLSDSAPGPGAPRVVYVGTHDDAILEVLDGRADAGAIKDTRLDDFERENPARQPFRRLSSSQPVPSNALVVRADVAEPVVEQLRSTLLAMSDDPVGQAVLRQFGAARFVPTRNEDYEAIYRMIDEVGPDAWKRIDVVHPAPSRPYVRE